MFDTKNLRDYTLNKENILNLTDENTLFKYYCPLYDGTTSKFSSEFRDDNNPSCSIKQLVKGYWYRDFGSEDSFDVFGYIQKKYNCTYYESLNIINTDFKLNLGYGKSKESVLPSMGFFGLPNQFKTGEAFKRSTIKVQVRNWNQKDKDYWEGKYFITKELLKKYHVYPLKYYCINDNWFHKPEYCYGYYCQGEEWKIYQPFEQDYKFFNNISEDFYCGYQQLPKNDEVLIITSSRKDVLCWALYGYSAISPQSETYIIKPEFIKELQSRFKKIYINYDQDLEGQKQALKYKEFINIYTPDYKDLSDTLEYKGYEYTKELIKQLI